MVEQKLPKLVWKPNNNAAFQPVSAPQISEDDPAKIQYWRGVHYFCGADLRG